MRKELVSHYNSAVPSRLLSPGGQSLQPLCMHAVYAVTCLVQILTILCRFKEKELCDGRTWCYIICIINVRTQHVVAKVHQMYM